MARDRVFTTSQYRTAIEDLKKKDVLGLGIVEGKDVFMLAVALGLSDPQPLKNRQGLFLKTALKTADKALMAIHRHGRDPEYVATMGLCPCCGSPVDQLPGRKTKKFCSDACCMKWWAQHQEQMDRTLYTITCTQCGCSFESANPKRKFCGRACYADNRRKDTQLP